jgi:hypothetical protein
MNNSYVMEIISLGEPVRNLLTNTLNNQRKLNQESTSVPFRAMRKREQNALIMNMLTKINYQILKFNVKKLFQIWALYHPEDINCQIISQIMFKKNSVCNINTIRKEIQVKNRKSKRSTRSSTNYARYENKISGGLYATLQVKHGERLTIGVPETKLELFRALDNRGLLQCTKFFSTSIYRIKDLPPIMCYSDYHIDRLIETCRKSKSFPIHLLPVYLRKDANNLLRM